MKVVFASYLRTLPDPQRKIQWPDSLKDVQPLMDSLSKKSIPYVIFHDGVNLERRKDGKRGKYVKCELIEGFSPSVNRWFFYLDYLKAHPEITHVWMVDSTDVEALKNPFNIMKPDTLYVGSERDMKVENGWMQRNQEPYFKAPDYREIISKNGHYMLMNCGIVGGERDLVIDFLEKKNYYHKLYNVKDSSVTTDMACFNYVIWKHFKPKLDFGVHVNTHFKGYEYDNKIAVWRHK